MTSTCGACSGVVPTGTDTVADTPWWAWYRNDDGMIDFEEFSSMNKRYPSVLFPIFRLQDSMQRFTLGGLQSCWVVATVLGFY